MKKDLLFKIYLPDMSLGIATRAVSGQEVEFWKGSASEAEYLGNQLIKYANAIRDSQGVENARNDRKPENS